MLDLDAPPAATSYTARRCGSLSVTPNDVLIVTWGDVEAPP